MSTVSALTGAILYLRSATGIDAPLTAVRADWVWRNAAEIVEVLEALRSALPPRDFRLGAIQELADDLMEMHDQTGVSLDAWVSAREVVEAYCGPIVVNGA